MKNKTNSLADAIHKDSFFVGQSVIIHVTYYLMAAMSENRKKLQKSGKECTCIICFYLLRCLRENTIETQVFIWIYTI